MKHPYKILFIILTLLPFSIELSAQCDNLGVNLGWLSNNDRALMYVDAMKTANNFTGTLDAKGWPTGDASVAVINVWNKRLKLDGVYKLIFNGKATVTASGATVSNLVFNTSTNTGTADITMSGSYLLTLNFKGTVGGVKNVRLIRPGYAANTSQVFTTPFLKAISNFKVLRLMDALNANWYNISAPGSSQWWNSKPTNWSDARPDNYATEGSNSDQDRYIGMSWQAVCNLGNISGKDLWINVPVSATDDYILQLANYMKANLNPNIKLYIEYSNEVWNTMFPQYKYTEAAAAAIPKATVANLVVDKITLISKTFRTVYGDAAMMTTVRPVWAWQISTFSSSYSYEMGYMKATYGDPSKIIYAMAGAPYFNAGTINTTGTVDQLITYMSDQALNGAVSAKQGMVSLSKRYGIHAFCYEGGPDNGGGSSSNLANRIAANYDPRMKDIISGNLLKNWFNYGGELFMYYKLTSDYSSSGMWGLSEDITDQSNAKWQGIYVAAQNCPVSLGTAGVSDELERKYNVVIYPNPAEDKFTIHHEVNNYEIVITDVLGQEMKRTSSNFSEDVEISTNGMKKGLYFVTVVNKEGQITQKLIVN